MRSLLHWDDLVHGTVVFGALVPLILTLLVGSWITRNVCIAAAVAIAVSFLCFFGLPNPPWTSDDILVSGWVVAVCLVTSQSLKPKSSVLIWLIGFVLWATLVWIFYPAWLLMDDNTNKRGLIVAMFAGSTVSFGALTDIGGREKVPLSPAALLPLAIGLAILLVTGGAAQFGQSCGAIAASIGGVCLLSLIRHPLNGGSPALTLWAMLLALLAWSGWFFAEIRPLSTALLFLSPLAAWAARHLPLPRHRPIQILLWDAIAAGLVVVPVLAVVLNDYLAGLSESEGY